MQQLATGVTILCIDLLELLYPLLYSFKKQLKSSIRADLFRLFFKMEFYRPQFVAFYIQAHVQGICTQVYGLFFLLYGYDIETTSTTT